jgi:TolB protein
LEKIAYVVDTVVGGKPERMIALIRPDGSGATALAIGDSPSWSPDGTKLVLTDVLCSYYDPYYGTNCGGGLIILDPETGGSTVLADGSAAFRPAWSPTGDVIAFTRCCVYGDNNRIYLARPDGSQLSQLTIPEGINVSNPGWSPDGKRIAFTSSNGTTNDLCVIDVNGSGFARLISGNASGVEGRPAWRPDATSIAFARSPVGSTRPAIFLLSLDNGAVTRVTDGSEPAWSPDGSRLVFRGAAIGGLFTVNVDGSNLRPLTTGAHSAPAWRP